jgi:hypothetical protein
MGNPKLEIREPMTKLRNSREEAQNRQKSVLFPNLLRLLRLFAARLAIDSRNPNGVVAAPTVHGFINPALQ